MPKNSFISLYKLKIDYFRELVYMQRRTKRIRVRPGKPTSMMGMITGVIFVFIGILVAVPMAGAFGVLWTLLAVGITGYHAYNFFSDKGVTSWEIGMDEYDHEIRNHKSTSSGDDFETRLRKLNRLKEEGLITE